MPTSDKEEEEEDLEDGDLEEELEENKLVTEVCHLGHFWLSYGRCATSGSPMGRSKRSP